MLFAPKIISLFVFNDHRKGQYQQFPNEFQLMRSLSYVKCTIIICVDGNKNENEALKKATSYPTFTICNDNDMQGFALN